MFSKFIAPLFFVACIFHCVFATPTGDDSVGLCTPENDLIPGTSFDNWHGLSSLSGFDDFYGIGNFDGYLSKQEIVEKNVRVCRAQRVSIVQQRLLILQELAKRVVTEFVCDVETQVIVYEQFHNSMRHFKDDLGRNGDRRPGFDENVSNQYCHIVDSSGQLTTDDLGLNGRNVGMNTVVFGGSNWNENKSPASVADAFDAVRNASMPNTRS